MRAGPLTARRLEQRRDTPPDPVLESRRRRGRPHASRVRVACMKGRKAARTTTTIATAVDPHTQKTRE